MVTLLELEYDRKLLLLWCVISGGGWSFGSVQLSFLVGGGEDRLSGVVLGSNVCRSIFPQTFDTKRWWQ